MADTNGFDEEARGGATEGALEGARNETVAEGGGRTGKGGGDGVSSRISIGSERVVVRGLLEDEEDESGGGFRLKKDEIEGCMVV